MAALVHVGPKITVKPEILHVSFLFFFFTMFPTIVNYDVNKSRGICISSFIRSLSSLVWMGVVWLRLADALFFKDNSFYGNKDLISEDRPRLIYITS